MKINPYYKSEPLFTRIPKGVNSEPLHSRNPMKMSEPPYKRNPQLA
jgi:hypothetical protein